jgi:PIN domain nuclease of toxin-antitoxin system
MAPVIHLDTHVVVWLYAGRKDKFPKVAYEWLEKSELMISPMCLLELQYLYEIDRLSQPAQNVFDDLAHRISLKIAELPFYKIVLPTLNMNWTRDPFDRLIVSQAIAENRPLLTADQQIHKNLEAAFWEQDPSLR